jgi:mannosyl-oligosaccharide alpha-1,2-mannosidase
MGHLTCFAGGNLMLGGTYLGRSDITSLGADLVETCHHTYISTETHIGPESFQWFPSERAAAYEPQHEGQWEQVRKSGFWVTDARWMLRPETVESYFYAYRITGDKMYQEWAWDAYTAYVNASKAPYGYAEVEDVTKPAGQNNQKDKEESFWGAETLKYLYLIFCDEEVGNLDEWVFSTGEFLLFLFYIF